MVDITTVFMGVIYGLKTDLYLGAPILYGVGKKIINQLICFRKSQPGLVQAVLLGGDWNHAIFLVNLWLIHG